MLLKKKNEVEDTHHVSVNVHLWLLLGLNQQLREEHPIITSNPSDYVLEI